MAGIEDFVVEAVMNDMQQQLSPQLAPQQAAPQMTLEQAIASGNTAAQAQLSPFLAEAQYAAQFNRGAPPGAVSDPRAPMGYSIADPRQRTQAAQFNEESARRAALGGVLERGMRERDVARQTIMQGLRGLDPQIQSTILRRLGIDPGAVKSQIQQQKELLQFKQQLEAPQQETENAIKMMGVQRQLGQGERELNLKERELQSKNIGQAEGRNLSVIKVLAMMAQNNPQLQATIGPLLMQMLQGMGINLAPPASGGQQPRTTGGRGTFSPRPGVTITQEE